MTPASASTMHASSSKSKRSALSLLTSQRAKRTTACKSLFPDATISEESSANDSSSYEEPSEGSLSEDSDDDGAVGDASAEAGDSLLDREDTAPGLEDSSDDEDRPGSKRKGPRGRPKAPQSSENNGSAPPSAKAPCFNWSKGDRARAQAYLTTQYYEWVKGSRTEQNAVLKRAVEHIVTKYSFPKHKAGDVRSTMGDKGAVAAAAERGATNEYRNIQRLMKKIKGRATSAAHLWPREHPDIVRANLQSGSIGEWQRVVKELFGKLSKAEQREWKEKAKDMYAEEQNDPNCCFENRKGFLGLVAKLLSQFVGFGPDGVEAVVIDIRVGMREEDGSIMQMNLTIGAPASHPVYDNFEGFNVRQYVYCNNRPY
ncbi:hypothetical protein OH77DRAFT_1580448 [Trametes cingulata]|nr:hypothetical protein OH77DRAFT_1580448 [Trametes cingulata]